MARKIKERVELTFFVMSLSSIVRLSKGVVIHFGDYGTVGLREQHCNSTGTRQTVGSKLQLDCGNEGAVF